MNKRKFFAFFTMVLLVVCFFSGPVTIPGFANNNSSSAQLAALRRYLDSGANADADVHRILSSENVGVQNIVLPERKLFENEPSDEPDIITHHNLDGTMYETEEYGWVEPEPMFVPLAMFDKTLLTGTAAPGGNPYAGRIVIGIAGDGYQDDPAQKTAFLNMAQQVADRIVGFYPFNLFQDYVNIYAIEIHSTDSGITDESVTPNIIKNTYFEAKWTINSNLAWGLRMNYTKMTTVRNTAFGSGNSVSGVVLVNSKTPAIGGGYSNGSASGTNCVVGTNTASAAGNTAIHELGHALGNLGDEYDILSGQSERVNRTAETNANPSTVKWRAFLGAESQTSTVAYGATVDILRFTSTPGHHSYPWFRPTTHCCMKQSGGQPFCMVCNVELVRELASRTGISSHYFAAPAWNTGTQTRSLPAGATRVLDYAFACGSGLNTVNLPDTITTVGYMAFLNCTNLNQINIDADIPPTFPGRNGINGAFIGVTRGNIDLHVPNGTAAAYQTAWPGFNDYIESSPPDTYAISLSQSGSYTFTSSEYGYTLPHVQTITLTNTGNQPTGTLTVALGGDGSGNFQIFDNGVTGGISPGSNATFKIAPIVGLSVGTYDNATVTVSGSASITPQSFAVSFSVTRATVFNTASDAVVTFSAEGFNITTLNLFEIDPNAGAQSYSIESDGSGQGTITENILTVTKAGLFRISLETAETDTHAMSRVTADLTVHKANPAAAPVVTAVIFTNGMTLGDVKLPDGWIWQDSTVKLAPGQQSFTAVFAGDDNYNPLTVTVSFVVKPKNTGETLGIAVTILCAGLICFIIPFGLFKKRKIK